jgi:hypothetical protein
VAALLVFAAACGGVDRRAEGPALDSATRAAIRAESVTASAVAARPPSALWDVDRVAERLVRAAVGPRRIEPPPAVPPFLAGATTAAFTVARGGEVRVFLFRDSTQRRAVTELLDPATAAPVGVPSPWPSPPLLIISGNLAAVMLGSTPVQRERVQLALEAGLASQ